jgi:hypothetical protein
MDESYEPPRKKMKYESKLLQFSVGYVLKDGTICLTENKNDKVDGLEILEFNKVFKPVLQFQSVEGADIYMIGNLHNNLDYDIFDINKGYTLDEIYNYFMNGKFHIGSVQHYNNDYKNGIYNIRNINTLDDDNNYEIKLHYTTSRTNSINVAWRSITWDLFSEYVPQTIF